MRKWRGIGNTVLDNLSFCLVCGMLVLLLWDCVSFSVVRLLFEGRHNSNPPPTTSPSALLQSMHDRWLTHVSTDKPLYKRGDTVFFRGVILNAFDRSPLNPDVYIQTAGEVQIISPKGDAVHSINTFDLTNSVIAGSWRIPPHQIGGEYTLKVNHKNPTMPSGERKFTIQPSLRNPRLSITLEFLKKGYGPSDEVVLLVKATRVEGGMLSRETQVSIRARVDGEAFFKVDGQMLDETGLCTIKFNLPPKIEKGEGSVDVIVEDGGVTESKSKTIPILLQKVDIQLYPEGGELVAGLPNTVYFQALTPWNDPVDIQMKLTMKKYYTATSLSYTSSLSSSNVETITILEHIETKHEGRGKFVFVPGEVSGEGEGERNLKKIDYELVVVKPAGISQPIPLPTVKRCGAIVAAVAEVFEVEDDIAATVSYSSCHRHHNHDRHQQQRQQQDGESQSQTTLSNKKKSLTTKTFLLQVFQREKEISSRWVRLEHLQTVEVALSLPHHICGVLRFTLTDTDTLLPVSERLIFRRGYGMESNHTGLQIEIHADQLTYTPGGQVTVTFQTSLRNGRDTGTMDQQVVGGAILGIAVTDDAVLQMVEKRKQPPRLPVMVFLEDDVQKLEDAHVYLDPHNPIAPMALDLLLGTQGWRRFIYTAPEAFLTREGEKAKRLLAYNDDVYNNGNGQPRLLFGAMEEAAQSQLPLRVKQWKMENIQEDQDQDQDNAQFLMDDDHNLMDMGSGESADEVQSEFSEATPARAPAPRLVPAMAKNLRAMKNLFHYGEAPVPAIPRREFAFKVRPNRQTSERRDFTETVYWGPAVKTDEQGLATISFGLSDAITTFRLTVDGFAVWNNYNYNYNHNSGSGSEPYPTSSGVSHSRHTLFGLAELLIQSTKPFYVDAKLPNEISLGDHLIVPISLINGLASPEISGHGSTNSMESGPHLVVDLRANVEPNSALYLPQEQANLGNSISVPHRHRGRALVEVDAVGGGEATLTIQSTARLGGVDQDNSENYSDTLTRHMKVSPSGFPASISGGGILSPKKKAEVKIDLRDVGKVDNLEATIRVYATPAANLMQALQALLREPFGCFEQTSATTYPLVMAQQYFKTHSGVDPSIVSRANSLLETGYKRLVGFEAKTGGFEWFGQSPGHEALTAYGLLQFIDMAKVMPSIVDQQMIERTQNWLFGQKNQNGFNRNSRALDSFGAAPDDITNAYIVWSLTYAGLRDGLDQQIQYLNDLAGKTDDPYLLALVAGTLYNIGETQNAHKIATRISKFQHEDGSVFGAETSITRSRGDALLIETTSIAILCWLNEDDQFAHFTERAIHWLATRSKDGAFASTQATILALKAIIAYDIQRASPKAPGSVTLTIDGKFIDSIAFTEKTSSALTFSGKNISEHLELGAEHVVELTMQTATKNEHKNENENKNVHDNEELQMQMPYSMQVTFNAEKPPSAEGCAVELETKLAATHLQEGEATDLIVKLRNLQADSDQGMAVAIVGLPAGLQPRIEKLKELVESKQIAFFELTGREIVFYWRGLAPGQQIELRVDMTAAIPGHFKGPASRAYLYYQNEVKHWNEALAVQIVARQ